MTRIGKACFGATLTILAALAVGGSAMAATFAATGMEGLYKVELAPPGPLQLNAMQSWVITVTDANGQPIEHADIAVSGGMPAHGHGLPTAPAISAELGGGRYQLDGVKFNMTGQWVLQLEVTATTGRDTVSVELDVQP